MRDVRSSNDDTTGPGTTHVIVEAGEGLQARDRLGVLAVGETSDDAGRDVLRTDGRHRGGNADLVGPVVAGVGDPRVVNAGVNLR